MDDLDEHTCTLGLTGSRRASKSRRIVLARHASLLLEVDPHAPNKVQYMSWMDRVRQRCPYELKEYVAWPVCGLGWGFGSQCFVIGPV